MVHLPLSGTHALGPKRSMEVDSSLRFPWLASLDMEPMPNEQRQRNQVFTNNCIVFENNLGIVNDFYTFWEYWEFSQHSSS